jgi:Zn ribbon nucleic-acid-binding protein
LVVRRLGRSAAASSLAGSVKMKNMKLKKVCPECGGTEIYTKRLFTAGHLAGLTQKLGSIWSGAQLDAYACVKCGYYQLHIPDEYLQQMKENWDKYS